MPTFEEGFAAAENAADSMLKALGDVATLARQLRRASQDGNIAAIRRTSERLDANVNRIRQEAANAANAWPFTEEAEREYLEDGYAEELKGEAQKKGLQVFDRDGRQFILAKGLNAKGFVLVDPNEETETYGERLCINLVALDLDEDMNTDIAS